MNAVTLIGRLDTDPAARLVDGQTVVRIRLAIDDHTAGQSTVVDVDVFGRQGTAVDKYLRAGRLVGITGRLTSSLWRDGLNNRRQHVFVTAHAVEFLDKPTTNGDNRAKTG
jgi:single-strand DNA-binding protein